jgi:hypothetical protein
MIVEIIYELYVLVDKVPNTNVSLERRRNDILGVQLLIELASCYAGA